MTDLHLAHGPEPGAGPPPGLAGDADDTPDRALSDWILVVDDDAVNLMVLEHMLEIAGYAVERATDGVEAVEKAAKLRPALVLMDLSMPRMNGIDAAIAIRNQAGRHCPKIVAVTAHATGRHRAACAEAGFDGFLTKPVNMQQLIAAVGGVVGRG
jgi:CheY-like chemotaxis protein